MFQNAKCRRFGLRPPCECQPTWPWKGKTFKGCDPIHPEDPSPWCYVKDPRCKDSKASTESPGQSWRYCAPGGCPGSSMKIQRITSVNTVSLHCEKFAPLDKFCKGVEKHLHKLGAAGRVRMAEIKDVSPNLYHSSCKKEGKKKQWWERGENRPQKSPKDKCLQGSSCLSIQETRGPEFITDKNFCGGKGVQFKYEVDPKSKQTIFEFMDREDFRGLRNLFLEHRLSLSTAYSPELITNHLDTSFKDGEKVTGETVKFVMDMFKIPGYFSSQNDEICLENNLLKKVLKEGTMIFEDDHKV